MTMGIFVALLFLAGTSGLFGFIGGLWYADRHAAAELEWSETFFSEMFANDHLPAQTPYDWAIKGC